MVASSPRSSGTCGVQPPSSFCASAMSGLRRTGSSLGKGYPRGTPIHYKGANSGANGTAISGNEGELSVAERSNSKP
jgi:hypothetical protein